MKMADSTAQGDEPQAEYDEATFSNAVRGKYAASYKTGANVVRIAPDLAADFPNEEAANEALRFVQKVAQDANRLTKSGR
jgi:hypothetical protein